jgi:hypothetical protein
MKEIVNLMDRYRAELALVRNDLSLLENYRFEIGARNHKHFERLRLNIAIYNDLRDTDYDIVKFLFNKERKWREYDNDGVCEELYGNVDNLYFSAFILSLFKVPENIWIYWETKNINMDCGIGFDGEFLVSAGIRETYQYLNTFSHPNKENVLEYLGNSEEECYLKKARVEGWTIEDWRNGKHQYFRNYRFPVEHYADFFYNTNEKELFVEELSNWINQHESWTYSELWTYEQYARYIEDKIMQIEVCKMKISHPDGDSLRVSHKEQLAELYSSIKDFESALSIIEEIIIHKNSAFRNSISNCIQILCNIIIVINNSKDIITKKAYRMIVTQLRNCDYLPPITHDLLKDVHEMMKEC